MSVTLTVSPSASPFPFAALITAAYLSVPIVFDVQIAAQSLSIAETIITSELEIVESLAKTFSIFGDSLKTPALLKLANTLSTTVAFPDIVAALTSTDDHLTYRTFLVGYSISAADFMLWGVIKGSPKIIGVLKGGQHPHVSRWYNHIDSFQAIQDALIGLAEARANKARSNKTSSAFALGLPDAIDGKVVTRFPPEPSGYLHIGHAKAAMLNQYFAKMYHGKLIIRFDDTNPSKEKTEFEDTILEDLHLLDVHGDQVTHTSDHFDFLYKSCLEIIRRGKAYADDTVQLQMRDERMNGVASARRDSSVEENLQRFDEMTRGTEEGQRWCIRAKISVDDNNKALRDPVIYRVNVTPHHRTGSKWKVYPTYDFACPLVDALEGVTHALRTNEYRDRNPQYYWMLDALDLRKVTIWDFSRLNFIYTLLSKRKLHWFVDNGFVEGWDDPRFPTVRGIRRRGLTVEAIKQYMLVQGPSQSVVSLEWDSIWSINKKIIDPIAPRFWAIANENRVKVNLKGFSNVEVKTNSKHKKNPDVGTKETVYGPVLIIEQEDAVSFEDNEEITLMDWGNAFVRSKTADPNGCVTSIDMELHLEGDFKKTKKKITWLAEPSSTHPHVNVVLHDYDYLITKKKLEENDQVADFVAPVTEFKVEAVSDANIRDLKIGDIIQFERKGYYIFDAKTDEYFKFIRIPDGKAATTASKAEPNALKAVAPSVEGEKKLLSNGTSGFDIPIMTDMYEASRIYGQGDVEIPIDTKMYVVKSVYSS